MSYKIEITENSVSIRTQEEVFDKDGNPVGFGKPHRIAIAKGDFAEDPNDVKPSEENLYKQRADNLILEKTGKRLRDFLQ